MGIQLKILIVGDEMLIGRKISLDLSELGYDVTAVVHNKNEAVQHVEQNEIDFVILDIRIKGNMDGLETAEAIQKVKNIPFIYLSDKIDENIFSMEKLTAPAGFIYSPFKSKDLQRAIEVALSKLGKKNTDINVPGNKLHPVILSDRIFIRSRERMVKIMVADILFIEADRNYSRIFTAKNEYLLSTTLKTIEEKLSQDLFVRVHRSYMVNLMHVDEVGDGHVVVFAKAVPLSSGYRSNFLERIQTL